MIRKLQTVLKAKKNIFSYIFNGLERWWISEVNFEETMKIFKELIIYFSKVLKLEIKNH